MVSDEPTDDLYALMIGDRSSRVGTPAMISIIHIPLGWTQFIERILCTVKAPRRFMPDSINVRRR